MNYFGCHTDGNNIIEFSYMINFSMYFSVNKITKPSWSFYKYFSLLDTLVKRKVFKPLENLRSAIYFLNYLFSSSCLILIVNSLNRYLVQNMIGFNVLWYLFLLFLILFLCRASFLFLFHWLLYAISCYSFSCPVEVSSDIHLLKFLINSSFSTHQT